MKLTDRDRREIKRRLVNLVRFLDGTECQDAAQRAELLAECDILYAALHPAGAPTARPSYIPYLVTRIARVA